MSQLQTEVVQLREKTLLLEARAGNTSVQIGSLNFSSLEDAIEMARKVPDHRYEFFLDVVSLLEMVKENFAEYAVVMQLSPLLPESVGVNGPGATGNEASGTATGTSGLGEMSGVLATRGRNEGRKDGTASPTSLSRPLALNSIATTDA